MINCDDCLSTRPGSNATAKGAIARARDRLPLVDFSWRSGCLNMRKSGFFKDGEKQQKSVSARFGCFLSPSIWVGGGVFGELSYGGSPIGTYRSSANSQGPGLHMVKTLASFHPCHHTCVHACMHAYVYIYECINMYVHVHKCSERKTNAPAP